MTTKTQIVFGADPEVFATYEGADGTLYALPPVILRRDFGVRASKDPRHPVFIRSAEWMAHEDGAAFEVAVKPSKDWREVFGRVRLAYEAIENRILSPISESHGVCHPKLTVAPTIAWEISLWDGEDNDFFTTTRFGCDPDEDAFDYLAKCHVDDASKHPYRYGGGHIHLSGFDGIEENPLVLVHSLAFTVGLGAVVYSKQHDSDRDRTFRYGRPGKYRVQRYGKLFEDIPFTNIGIEYRPISNAWTADEEEASKLFELAQIGVDALFKDNAIEKLWHLNTDVQRAIVDHDVPLATDLLNTVLAAI